MNRGSATVSLLLVMLVLVVIAGFYFTLSELDEFGDELEDFRLVVMGDIAPDNVLPLLSEDVVVVNGSFSDSNVTGGDGLSSIPTAIVFNVLSDPRLQPQANISIVIESVSRDDKGIVIVNIKAFTNEASSYSSLVLSNLFELVDLTSSNKRPVDVVGKFDSLPARSVIEGSVLFNSSPSDRFIILQINTGDDIKHYEFDFVKGSYREAVLG